MKYLSVRTIAILLQNIYQLFAHATYWNKVGEQFLLLFCQPGFSCTLSRQIISAVYQKSGIRNRQCICDLVHRKRCGLSCSDQLRCLFLLSGVVELRISDSTGSSSGISRSSGSSLSVGLNSSCSPAAIDS